jgi:type VI secretion system secreted protein VgrG
MIVKIVGEDITNTIAHLSLELSVCSHSSFTLRITAEDRSNSFKGSLSELSKKWIGKPIEVGNIFKGVMTSVSLSRTRAGSSDFIIRGQSPTIHLDDGINVRSFGEKTLQQILDVVMQPYQSKFNGINFKAKQGKIKYCVQYRESNFAFINRLASRYGEWFYYDGIELVFGKPTRGQTIDLSFLRDITHFDISLKTVPVNFKLKIYDYKKHDFPQKESSYPTPSNPYAKIAFDKSKNDIFPNTSSVPINLSMNESDLDQIVTLRQNVHLNELVVLSASSTKQDLKLGSVIKLVDTRDELDSGGTDDYGEYIIINITHEISEQGATYSNHFEAIPKDAAIPPFSISPDPPPCEMQMAKVVENHDPKALGRIRVQFLWQDPKETSANDAKSPWIRVASPYTGKDLGFYFIPEIGEQVLVGFDHNHPERPFVISGMFNNEAKPAEFAKPDNHLKIIKTKGKNQIQFWDDKDKEQVVVISPKDIVIHADTGVLKMDAKGNITIESHKGSISISAAGDISMSASNISLDASNAISMKAKEITEKGDVSVTIEAPKVAIEGKATANIKSPMVEVNGSAMTIIKGAMVKIN